MAKLSDAQIAGHAKSAGVTGENLAIAVAVALAESQGNTLAHNAVPPDNSYGLWQINMLGSLGPARRKEFGISTNDALYDPGTNARAMYKISGGGKSWSPWTTYTSGKYRVYMARGRTAAGNPGATPATDVSIGDNLDNIKKVFTTLSDPQTWIRIGLFVAGFIMLIIGIFKMTGDNKLSEGTKSLVKFAVMRKLPVK
jgi:hypothetical protein